MYNNYNLNYSYSHKKKLNILIVDDDTQSSELFKEILELNGYNVNTLDEGMKCISRCMKDKYDIIFLDYHIGDIDGADLADCLKDVLKIKSLIYAYTGDSNPDIIKKCQDIGMNGALIKPININIINNIMKTIEQNVENNNNKFNLWT
jgi:two-component system sensor histidine kinase TorS